MKICRPETPQAAADVFRPWFGRSFSAAITGEAGSGKTTAVAHAIHAAVEAGIPLHLIAAFSPTTMAANRLRQLVGSFWPTASPRDLFGDGMSGTPIDAARERTTLRFERVDRSHKGAVKEFTALIKRVGEIGDGLSSQKFLQGRETDICRAIHADIEARLTGQELPLIAWLHEIADFYRAFKQRNGLVDVADLHLAPVAPMHDCALLFLDDIGALDRALLRRIFPAASVVTTGPADQPCDLCVSLGESLRRPERIELEDQHGPPSLVPVPGGSVLILLPGRAGWRYGEWCRWCDACGLPFRDEWRSPEWRGLVAAWRLDRGEEVPFIWIETLLAASGLDCADDEGLIDRDDIPRWRSWRELAIRPALIRAADHILARFGSLRDIPVTRILQARAARGIEAETVIVDCFARGLPEVYPLALSRATRRLIILQGHRAAQRIQVGPLQETDQGDAQQFTIPVHDQR